MTKIIAIANQKGGIGKTTTALAMSNYLHRLGLRSLLVDMDPQANASDTYQAELFEHKTMYDLFVGAPAIDCIQHTEQGDIIAGSLDMAMADSQFNQQGREYILKNALQPILGLYDYIVIDTPPALGIITVNSFTAATSVIIPMVADRYSMQGIAKLSLTVDTTRQYSNPDLVVDGILLTKYNPRVILNRQIKDMIVDISEQLHTKVYRTYIRSSIAISESQTCQQSIFSYDDHSTVASDYADFVKEYLEG